MILVETRVSYDRTTDKAKEAAARSAVFRTFVHHHTMMWGTDALRVLPTALWSEFAETVDRFKKNLAGICDIKVYYLPYPANPSKPVEQLDLFAETVDELRRRRNVMYTDVCHRIGLLLDDLNAQLKMDNEGGKPSRLFESVFAIVPSEVRLFRAFNEAAFNSNALTKILDGMAELGELDVDALRKNKQQRQEAWQKSIDLLNLLSKA